MPVYEFECQKCGASFQETVSIAEFDKRTGKFRCPKCKSRRVEQVLSQVLVETSKKS